MSETQLTIPLLGFCADIVNTPRGPDIPTKFFTRHSRLPPLIPKEKTNFRGGNKLFDSHPFAWKNPTPPGSPRTQKVNLCAPFFLPECSHNYYRITILTEIFTRPIPQNIVSRNGTNYLRPKNLHEFLVGHSDRTW